MSEEKERSRCLKEESDCEPCERIIKTIVEEHVSSGNVHSAGGWWNSYIPSIKKPISTNCQATWSYCRPW